MKKALYRELRPKNWKDVIDKDLIVEVLKNQVKNGTTSHGYLFCGVRGTGKTSCAKILARAVNCLNLNDGEPCNECENCREILNDRAIDVLEIDAASNNGVDNIRELKELGIYPPTNLKKKVYIIDEAHMLSNSAFNALLKILEEPPEHLIFILATTEPEKLPDTVKSRLQRFDFNGIRKDAIINKLKQIVKALNEQVDDEVFSVIAENAGGSMRDALSMLDQLFGVSTRPITIEVVTELLGITGLTELMPLYRAIFSRDKIAAINESKNLTDKGRNPEKLVFTLLKYSRDLLFVKFGEYKLVPMSNLKNLKLLAQMTTDDVLIDMTEELRKLLDELQYAFDKELIFSLGMLGLANKYDGNVMMYQTSKQLGINESTEPAKKLEPKKDCELQIEEEHIQNTNVIPEIKFERDVEVKTEENIDGKAVESKKVIPVHKDTAKGYKEDKPIQNEEAENIDSDVIDNSYNDDGSLENKQGNEIFMKAAEGNPLLQFSSEKYYKKLVEKRLVLTPKDFLNEDTVLEQYMHEFLENLKQILGEEATVYITPKDENVKKAIDLFGDKLEIVK